ncbi:uncharacterized protein LOC135367486 [Ornithodoros turicata]|uniref:uncharacterized protein LOC135367486 n=1 Tax=Ornithodoros turicata TaxID=34597 RepID=UPI003139D7F8
MPPAPSRTREWNVLGGADLPRQCERVLKLGPKFCAPVKPDKTELLALVRKTATRAHPQEVDRCISCAVDTLPATASPCARFKTNSVVEPLRERNLKLLQTDKEGGFAVLPSALYYRKAQEAMDDNFVRTNHVPRSLRKRAIELCEKRHTWTQPVGRFIQKALSALEIEDPFLVFRPSDVSDFLKGLSPRSRCVFSLDVKDLYYSLPQDELIEVVSEGIDRYGTVRFQNQVGVDVSTFPAVLRLYLQSTTVEFLGGVYLQRAGVCIGSCVAPVLSNLLLARYDRRLERALRDMGVRRVFRFVDDYLIIFDTENVAVDERTEHITRIFQRTLSPFTLTRELPVEHRLRFLDLELAIEPDHLCWIYAPRSKKGLLPFSSAHSKLVKRSIALSAMENAVKRSCPNQVQRSLLSQVLRLKTAGFPVQLIRGLAEVLLGKLHKKHEEAPRHDRSSRIAAIPYIHAVSHNIKKVAQRAGVSVVFTAPNKLGGLCRRVNSEEAAGSGCNKKHLNKLNIQMHGRNTNIIKFTDSLEVFLCKVENWKKSIKGDNAAMFERLASTLSGSDHDG